MLSTRSLLVRTAGTIALALLLFVFISLGTAAYFVAIPIARQSADDLAALMVLTAETCQETPAFNLSRLREQLFQDHGLIVADTTTANPIIYLQQAQRQYTSVYLSKGADLEAIREVPADVAMVESWLASGRRVFVVSPARQSSLAKKLEETGLYRLVLRDPLYEILPAEGPND